jgi:hypothetical protein
MVLCVLQNFFDAGSCIDGRLTSAWNWCSKVEKKVRGRTRLDAAACNNIVWSRNAIKCHTGCLTLVSRGVAR